MYNKQQSRERERERENKMKRRRTAKPPHEPKMFG
jgi:hypothetical protein